MSERTALTLHRDLDAVWNSGRGWKRLSAVNHSVVGRRFILTAAIFFAIGGMLAMLIRAQLATSHSAFMEAEIYNQIFTMHGAIMMFLFAIPMIEGLAIFLLPKLLGARDLAFPRLTAYGYWCYLFGGSIMILALLMGAAPDGGWFMYTPLTSKTFSPGINSDVWLLGITFVEISAICAAVEIAVSILKMRAPGMSLDRMPIFAWYMLVTVGMMLVGFPPLILGSVLLEVERAFDWPFFDPTRGGDSLLWQHLFWLFGHPEVYIIFLPAAGMVSTILPVFARRALVGYSWIVVSIIALGFISFGLWVHHMFTVGIPHLALGFFSAASLLVVIPTGVQIFGWLATLLTGRPQLKLPMLFILGFFFVFVIGGLTGVMVAVVPFDWQVHDTHFIVAHLHYVLVGGFVFPVLAAAYYWLPLFTGRQSLYRLGHAAFWLIFIGFNMNFFLMHLTGLLGMPRRVATYPPGLGWDLLNLISSVGGFIMAIGFGLFAADLLLQARLGRRASHDPWDADTLEWTLAKPPTSYAFASLPHVESRHPLHDRPDLAHRLTAGDGYLPFVRHGWMETLAVSMTTGRPEHTIILPRSTFKPLWAALGTGLFFVGLLLKIYPLAILGLILAPILLLTWTRDSGLRRDLGALDIGHGVTVPTQYETAHPPSWWAVIFTLVANATLFGSLLFGALFLWVVAPGWPPPQVMGNALLPAAAALAGLVLAVLAGQVAVRANAKARRPATQTALVLAACGHLLTIGMTVAMLVGPLPDPTSHAYAAISGAIIVYLLLHAVIGTVFALFGVYRLRAGFISPARSLDLRLGQLWHLYTAVAGALALGLLVALPGMVAP